MPETRRSSRLARQQIAAASQVKAPEEGDDSDDGSEDGFAPAHESDDDEGYEAPATSKRGGKKRKLNGGQGSSQSRGRVRMKGKLSGMFNVMPNEVMGLICSFLSPADLLHTTQSSRIFARFLLAPSSASIWRQARQNLERPFPICPDDLTEQRYACLAFGTHCQLCGRHGMRTGSALWPIRRRWCLRCRQEVSLGNDPSYAGPDDFLSEHFITYGIYLHHVALPDPIMLRTDVQIASREIRELGADKAAISKYVGERKSEQVKRYAHASEVETWFERRADARATEIEEFKKERVQELRRLLSQENFDPIVLGAIPEYRFLQMPGFNKPKKLTEKEWSSSKSTILQVARKLISDELFLAAAYADAQWVERYYALWLSNIPPAKAFTPSCRIMSKSSRIKDFLSQWILEPAHFVAAKTLIGSLNEHVLPIPDELKTLAISTAIGMRREVELALVNTVPGHARLTSTLPHPSALLDLATSVFMLTGPRTMHNMPYRQLHRYFESNRKHDAKFTSPSTGWEYDKVSSTIMKEIVSLCGLNPKTCTHEELEEVNPFVVCLTCEGTKLPTMLWEQAPNHWRSKHPNLHESGSAWRVLDQSEHARFSDVWKKHHGSRVSIDYHCLRCFGSVIYPVGLTATEIASHLTSAHGITPGLEANDPKYRIRSRTTTPLDAIKWATPRD